MAFTRENYRMVREKLMEIMYWDKDAHPGERDVVEAAKRVAMRDLALLKAEIETGMYKKPIEKLAADIRLRSADRWFRGNVLPSLDERNGRCVIIGNWLHTDGLMARLKRTPASSRAGISAAKVRRSLAW
jgi:hypothetical protein